MYLGWQTPIAAYDKMSFIFRVIQGLEPDEQLIFWGNQQSFYQTDGSSRGGGHFGFQMSTPAQTANRINWGCYDDIKTQNVAFTGPPSGGSFTLSYAGQTTGAISYNSNMTTLAASVQSALEALSNLASGDISCTAHPNADANYTGRVRVRFMYQAGYGTAKMTANGASLTGGSVTTTGDGDVLRGSIPTLPFQPGVEVSPFYDWEVGEDYLMELYKSPKQDWVAAEINSNDNGNGDQLPGEIAWRVDVVRLSTGVRTHIRDLLVPNCKTTPGAMYAAVSWAEEFNTGTAPAWEVRWSEPRVDDRLIPTASISYGGGFTNTDIHANDHVGFRMKSSTIRTNATGQVLTHPGPVLRSVTQESLGNKTASSTMTITAPPDVASGELIMAVLANDWTETAPTAPGWKPVGSFTEGSAGPRLSFLTRLHDGSASYTFTKSASSNTFAGTLMAYYGADKVAPALFGTAGTSSTDTTAWSAPALDKSTNYGRIGVAVAARPSGAGADTTFGTAGSPIERTDTFGITGNWVTLAVAEEAIPGLSGQATAKDGITSFGHNVAVQFMVYPVLPRAAPVADADAGAWVETPLWQKVDEATPDSSDFITGTNAAACRLTFDDLTDPNANVGHVVRYAYRRQDAASASLLVELLQGASTVIASKTETIETGDDFVESSITLTTSEADAITNYADLHIRLTSTVS